MPAKTKEELLQELKKIQKQNLTLRKKAETVKTAKDILENEEIFKAIFENAEIGIALLHKSGKILNVNSSLQKMLGYSEKELLTTTVKNLTHPHDYKADKNLFDEILTGKRNQYQIEKRYITKDGQIIYVKQTVSSAFVKARKNKIIIGLIENITEQKQIANKLTSKQNLLLTLLKNSPDNIYFKDLSSKFVKVNEATAKKLGFKKPEELIEKTDYEIFGPEHASASYNDEQEIIRSGKPIIGKEEREDWPDGRTTWASTTKMPLYDSEGKIIGTFGISRDITENKLVQERIMESEQLYRSMFENSADGMFLMTDIFLDCNQAVCNLFRCDRDFLIGHSPAKFSPEVQPEGKNSLLSANEKINAALNGVPQRFYWQHKTKDSFLIDTEVSLNAITIGGKKLIQAVVRDISERKKSERIREALYEISEAAYTASDMNGLYKKIHEVVGKLMSAKNFYIALYDEKAEMLSFPYFVDEFDPPQPPKKLGRGLTEFVLRRGEATLIDAQKDLELRKTGDVELLGAPQAVWLGVPLKLGSKTIGVIVVQDYENEKAFGDDEMQILTFVAEQIAQVIERKKNSEEIKKIAEELKQLNSTKDKFFSIIAHDLRNPFITILGFTELLLSDYNELTDEEKIFYLDEMKKSAEISHNLLQNLLQWSRSQTGKIEFNPAELDFSKVINENLQLLSPSAARKGIEIISNVPSQLNIIADEDMLNTVLRNLITNAIKFTNKGGCITIHAEAAGTFAQISVADTGIGMNEPTIANLFRLDVSHSTPGTEEEAGTGLGLILCKEFIERNGGTISVQSQLGKGSKFIFSIPIASSAIQ